MAIPARLVGGEWLAVVGQDVQGPFECAVVVLRAVEVHGGVGAVAVARTARDSGVAVLSGVVVMGLPLVSRS